MTELDTGLGKISRRRVRFRQTDVARAIRAARDAGAGRVVVRVDGSIEIVVAPAEMVREAEGPGVNRPEVYL